MNFQQLKYALEIYRCRSINKAAQTLFISQPALSLAMKDLEGELGFIIFERSTKGISPTPEGSAFLQTAGDIIMEMEELLARYSRGRSSLPPSVLRISASRYSFVSSAVLAFYDKYFDPLPYFSIHLDEVDCPQVIQDVFSCKADLGIIHTVDSDCSAVLDNLARKGIVYELLFCSNSYVTFRKGHPLENKKEVTTSDFLQYPQVRITTREIDFYNNDTAFNFPLYGNSQKNIFTNSRNYLYDFLSHTDAVFFGITNRSIESLHPDLITIPVSNDPALYSVYVIYLKGHFLNLYSKSFVEILKNQNESPKPSEFPPF